MFPSSLGLRSIRTSARISWRFGEWLEAHRPGRGRRYAGPVSPVRPGSWAELGIAKSGYVASRCGWFSDRSVCYLASGRPVLAQETGFSDFLPTGEGLLAFETVDDVLAGVEELRRDYARTRPLCEGDRGGLLRLRQGPVAPPRRGRGS